MQQLLAPPSLPEQGRLLQYTGKEVSSLYPNLRWLAECQQKIQALEDNLPLGAVAVLGTVCDAIERLRPGQPGLLDPQALLAVWEIFRDNPPPIWPSVSLQKAGADLAGAEALLFFSLLDEVRSLELRFQAHLRLDAQMAAVVADSAQAFKLFLGNQGLVPEGFEAALEGVLQGWSERLYLPEQEGRHVLCTLWATRMAGRFQASQQEWRYCLASLEQALQRHLGSRLGRLLQCYWNGLANATGRFEICLAVCKQLPAVVPGLGELKFDAQALVGGLLGDLLLDFEPLQQVWPAACAVAAAQSPLGGTSAEEFGAFRQRLLSAYRPNMERSWLDLLSQPLNRLQLQLDLQTWKSENRLALQELYASVSTSLAEVLQSFRKNPKVEQDLRCLLEAAWDSLVVGRSSAQAEHLYRIWLAQCYIPFAAPNWQQPRAVVAALKTALLKLSPDPRGQREGLLQLLSGIPPAYLQVTEGLQSGLEWLPAGGLERSTWLGWLIHGSQLGDWLGRFCSRDWAASDELQPRPNLAELSAACSHQEARTVFEKVQPRLHKVWMSHQLWIHSEAMARQASAWTFKHLDEYARQSGGLRGVEKCARDNAFTLRRVALAWELEVDDAAAFVSDWWNGIVSAYLVTRDSRLFLTNLQGLLESSRDYLDVDERSELESVLRPVYEGAASQEVIESSTLFEALNWSFPLEQKLQGSCQLDLSEEMLQSALRHARTTKKPLGPWRNLLTEGWQRYLWQGCLDTQFCKRWLAYCSEHVDRPEDIQRLLEGLQLAQDGQSAQRAIPRLDYFQSLSDFTAQVYVGPAWRESAREMVATALGKCLPAASDALHELLGGWLEQAAELMLRLPAPLWHWEADRFLLEEACRQEVPADFPWSDFFSRLGDRLDPAEAAIFSRWNAGHCELEVCFPALVDLASIYAHKKEPSFSPNPEEETQWRQAVSLLLVGAGRQRSEETELVLWALAHSLKISRDRSFAARLGKLKDLLGSQRPEVPAALYSELFTRLGELALDCWELVKAYSSWPTLRAGLGTPWSERTELDGVLLAALSPPTLSASQWATSASLRLTWTHNGPLSPLPGKAEWQAQRAFSRLSERVREEAVEAAPAELWQDDMMLPAPASIENAQDWQRDMRWLARRLAWQAFTAVAQESELHAPSQWYRHNVRLEGDLSWRSVALVAQRFAGQESVLKECYRLLEELEGGGWQLFVAGLNLPAQPWFCGEALPHAVSEACEAGQDPPLSAQDLLQFGQALSRHCEETFQLEQLPSRLQMSLRGYLSDSTRTAYLDRLCQCLLEVLPSSGLPVTDQLRSIEALSAVQSWLRHFGLALQLGPLLKSMDLAPGWLRLLQQQCLLWQLTSPQQAWLNIAKLLSEKSEGLLELDCLHLEKLGKELLDMKSYRVWSPWCRQLAKLLGSVARGRTLTQALARRDSPLRSPLRAPRAAKRFWERVVALEVLRDAGFTELSCLERANLANLPGERQQVLNYLRSCVLDVDLTPLSRQLADLDQRLVNQLGLEQFRAQGSAALQGLLANAVELVDLLLESGEGGLWKGSRILLLCPTEMLLRLASQGDRIQTALANTLGTYFTDASPLLAELDRLVGFCKRLPSFASVWTRADGLQLGGQPSHPLWRFLLRRLAWEGFTGQSGGALDWLRFNLSSLQQLDNSRKPFLRAAREAVSWARAHGQFNEAMNLRAEETYRGLQARLEGSSSAPVWERLGEAEVAPKVAKRTLWGILSKSLEGLTSVSK